MVSVGFMFGNSDVSGSAFPPFHTDGRQRDYFFFFLVVIRPVFHIV